MPQSNPKSGFSLMLIGIAGVLFFWITDPRYGFALHWARGQNPIDLANQHFPGTVVGIVGSIIVLLVGVYLVARRAV